MRLPLAHYFRLALGKRRNSNRMKSKIPRILFKWQLQKGSPSGGAGTRSVTERAFAITAFTLSLAPRELIIGLPIFPWGSLEETNRWKASSASQARHLLQREKAPIVCGQWEISEMRYFPMCCNLKPSPWGKVPSDARRMRPLTESRFKPISFWGTLQTACCTKNAPILQKAKSERFFWPIFRSFKNHNVFIEAADRVAEHGVHLLARG